MLFDVFKRKPKPTQRPEVTTRDIEEYLENKHYPQRKWKIDIGHVKGEMKWGLWRLSYNSHRVHEEYWLVDSFYTKEEALAKLEDIKDSPYYYD